MSKPLPRNAAAIERRDDARRRIWPITAAALAGGVMLTAAGSGLAWLTAPGRNAVSASTSAAPTSSSSSSTAPSSSALSPSSSFGTDSLHPSDQLPSYSGGGGGLPQAVTGGS
jgi:hypothetical protein